MRFDDLKLSEPILRAVHSEGYETPTPIQQKAIPHILDGKDIMGCAQTGTGKTAAFALPILSRLIAPAVPEASSADVAAATGAGHAHWQPLGDAHTPEPHGPVHPAPHANPAPVHVRTAHGVNVTRNAPPAGQRGRQHQQPRPHQAYRPTRVLVLTPTRELAVQIGESFTTYGKFSGLRAGLIFGGVGQGNQERMLRSGVDILVATPGRLLDLMNQGFLDFSKVEAFVLDEADRMLDMGFIGDIRKVITKLPANRQTLMFSATMPGEIKKLADGILRQPVHVAVAPVSSTAERVEQSVYLVERRSKPQLLLHLLDTDPSINRVLIFTRTKHGADRLAKGLNIDGVPAEAIHGNKSQNQRQRALDTFKKGKTRVLVATDIAARGLDIDLVSHVINFELPNEPESYVHRIGRTARAGASGIAISFCDGEERGYLKDIERTIGKKVPVAQNPPFLSDRQRNDGPNPAQNRPTSPQNLGGWERDNRDRPARTTPRDGSGKPSFGRNPNPKQHSKPAHAGAPKPSHPHAKPAHPSAHPHAQPQGRPTGQGGQGGPRGGHAAGSSHAPRQDGAGRGGHGGGGSGYGGGSGGGGGGGYGKRTFGFKRAGQGPSSNRRGR